MTCTQCGGELHPDEGQVFLTCPFCGATVYLDKSRVVFHWYVAPTLDAGQAQAELRPLDVGLTQTVKDLDKKSQVTGQAFRYFPLWYFRWKSRDSRKQTALQPAAATSVTELARLNLPAGDLRRMTRRWTPDSDPPTVPLEAGLDWFQHKHARSRQCWKRPRWCTCRFSSSSIPIPRRDLHGGGGCGQRSGAGEHLPGQGRNALPLVGGVAALVFLCLATLPGDRAVTDSQGGTGLGG